MPAVQVRDFSQETYDQIKAEAKACGRSIMQQTKHIVLQHFAQQGSVAGDVDGASPERAAAAEAAIAATVAGQSAPGASTFVVASQASACVNPFAAEASDAIAQRQERRSALMARISGRSYSAAFMKVDSAQVIREMRDKR